MTAAAAATLTPVEYGQLVDRVRKLVDKAVPRKAVVAVVSRGDPALVDLDGREAWHFPRSEDGVYAGHHPVDSADAIAQLETLRMRGAVYLVLPSTAFWWFDHYRDFARHLDGRYTLLARDEETCALYALVDRAADDQDAAGLGPLRLEQLASQISDVVAATLPDDATVLVLGGPDLAIDLSRAAFRDVTPASLDSRGDAGFLLVPATDVSSLDERPELEGYLARRYSLVVEQRNLCRIYELRDDG